MKCERMLSPEAYARGGRAKYDLSHSRGQAHRPNRPVSFHSSYARYMSLPQGTRIQVRAGTLIAYRPTSFRRPLINQCPPIPSG